MHCLTVFAIAVAATSCVFADKAKFEEFGVVPDVIDEAPEGNLNVTYEGGEKVDFGNVLTPTQVRNCPRLSYDYEEGALYTVIMTDPDAPSRADPSQREFAHCIVANIPGDNVDAGQELFGFVGSGPPQGTGLHRYVFLVYKQPGRLEFTEARVPNTSAEGRFKFSAKKWAADHGLGKPIAGNFYQAEWDEYVPIIHKQLGF